ncbi:hypothetical protein D3C75_1122240 [compost metagenome]
MQLHALLELLSGISGQRMFQRHQIGFLTLVARGGDTVRPLAVIGHQYQAGGINIQPPCRMQLVRDGFIQEIEHGWMIRIVGRAHITLWLIEHEVTWPVQL